MLPGVDVRGGDNLPGKSSGDGYIVAAPSAHKSGHSYVWVNEPGTVELAEWPPALLALMAARKHKDAATMQGAAMDSTPTVVNNVEAYVSKALQNTAETVATTPSGQRHDALLKAATSVGRLIEYVGKDRATAALVGAVEAWGGGVNDADTQTIADGLAYGSAHPKQLAVGAAAHESAASGAEATEPRKLFQIQPLSDFEHVPPQKWLIEGVLIEDSIAFMFGLPDCYKSFCAQAMAYAMYNGSPWYEKATVQGSVLYIAAEGVRGMYTRMRALAQYHGTEVPSNLQVIGQAVYFGEPAYLAQLQEDLAAMSEEQRPKLIIIDTLGRSTGPLHENDTKDMGMFVDALDSIRRATGACVLCVHHTSKAGEDMRGNITLRGAATTMLKVTRRGENSTEVTAFKQKEDAKFKPLILEVVPVELDPFTSSIVLRPTDEMLYIETATAKELNKAKVLTILQGGPLTSSEWKARAMAALDLSDTTVARYMRALKSEGTVLQQGRGICTLAQPTQAA